MNVTTVDAQAEAAHSAAPVDRSQVVAPVPASWPTLTAIVPITSETAELLPRFAESIEPGDFDRVIFLSIDAPGHFTPNQPALERLVGKPPVRALSFIRTTANELTQQVIVMAIGVCLPQVDTDWVCLIYPHERLAAAEHPATQYTERIRGIPHGGPRRLMECLGKISNREAKFAGLLVLGVTDAAGLQPTSQHVESRLARCPVTADIAESGFASVLDWSTVPIIDTRPVIYQPMAAFHFENGVGFEAAKQTVLAQSSFERAVEASKAGGMFNRGFLVKARTKIDTEKAFQGLKALFEHACLYEELGVARSLMAMRLPYTLEEDPRVDELRAVLQRQIGHLLTAGGEEGWYADGAVAEVLEDDFVSAGIPTIRMQWMCAEAKKYGLKRVVEFGALDGVSLFQALKLRPETEWTGVECNPAAVAHGQKLAATAGLTSLGLVHATFAEFAKAHAGEFDAAFCFEVLEHNWEPDDVLDAVERAVKPGGRVFLTTPNGAWSLHNPETYNLECRKEHIRAWTQKRTLEMLQARGATGIEIRIVENPNIWEANSWVFSSYTPRTKG